MAFLVVSPPLTSGRLKVVMKLYKIFAEIPVVTPSEKRFQQGRDTRQGGILTAAATATGLTVKRNNTKFI